MTKCKVSVALATYNGARYLQDQLDSIIHQKLKPDEIIVSDDHSTDATLDILEKYQSKGLIKFFSNPGKGVIANFKNAVSNCNTENYVALSDQDDIWDADKLEVSAAALSQIDDGHSPAIVFSDLLVVNENNEVTNKSFFKEIVGANPVNEKLVSLLFSNKVIGCTTMFNTSMRNSFEVMPAGVCMHDYWIALIAFTFGRHHYIDRPLMRYRRHSNNVTDASSSVMYKIKKELTDYLLNKRIQLDEHIDTVDLFCSKYGNLISEDQRLIMQKFIRLKNSTTIVKRLNSFYYTR